MFFFFLPRLAEALKSDRSFMDLLRKDARDRKNRIAGFRAEGGDADVYPRIAEESLFFHPDVDTLYDYILGSLTNKQMREVMDHLSECEECARKASEIRRLDKEITKDFKHYMQ